MWIYASEGLVIRQVRTVNQELDALKKETLNSLRWKYDAPVWDPESVGEFIIGKVEQININQNLDKSALVTTNGGDTRRLVYLGHPGIDDSWKQADPSEGDRVGILYLGLERDIRAFVVERGNKKSPDTRGAFKKFAVRTETYDEDYEYHSSGHDGNMTLPSSIRKLEITPSEKDDDIPF
jgi:hypothetical protein